MAGKYSLPIVAATLATTNDVVVARTSGTLGAPGSVIQAYELWLAGTSSSSTPASVIIGRSADGTTLTTATAQKLSPTSPAASFAYGTSWSAGAPSPTTVLLPAFNGFGNILRWVAPPGSAVVQLTIAAATPVCINVRTLSGVPVVNGHLLVEEL